MPELRKDPYQQFNFTIAISGNDYGGFMECSGLTINQDKIDYREGNYKTNSIHKIPGLIAIPNNFVAKRGLIKNNNLWVLYQKNIESKVERNAVVVTLRDEGRNPVLKWTLENAWISKLESGPFNAKTNDVAVETVEFIYESLKFETL
jgi:phage tail-like protein